MNFREIISKILSLLRAKSRIGGLEISDTELRFAYFVDGSLKTLALRMPPGIIDSGEIKNYNLLVEALNKLKEMIPADFGGKKTVNVVITLGSIHVYTQVFSLPLAEEDENMKEAIQLNIRMISPLDLSQAYTGWQLINHDKNELKIEILSAFAQKVFIDSLNNAVKEAGFFVLAVESGTLSIARLIRERGADFKIEKPLLVLSVDDNGLRFLIIRLGQLHFEYFQSWKDIQGEKKQVVWPEFEEAIKRNLSRVINFYASHWQEPLTELVIASNNLVEEMSKTIKDNFSINVRELKLKFDQPLHREWYEAAGSAMRGEIPWSEDKDVNLLGITVQEEFRHREIIGFLRFWQVLIPSSLSILLIFFVAGYVFLMNLGNSVESQSSFKLSSEQSEEISVLQSEIKNFNNSVKFLADIQKLLRPKTYMIDKLALPMNANNIVLDRVYFQAYGLPVIMSGETDSQDQILNFKNAMSADSFFSSVNLNLSDIKPQPKGFSFTISFGLK